jgi:hypothetical protein
MYFIIKYNVFNEYIINVTTTEINTCKKIFEFGQREVISFFTLVTNKGESTLVFTQSKQTLTGREPEKRIKHRERCTLASRI